MIVGGEGSMQEEGWWWWWSEGAHQGPQTGTETADQNEG
jgi:hypothetical protein